MKPKFVLMNGPGSIGKDFAIRYFNNSQRKLTKETLVSKECKGHLHKLTQEFFLVDVETYFRYYEDRSLKETPTEMYRVSLDNENIRKLLEVLPSFDMYKSKRFIAIECAFTKKTHINLSPREAMIFVSEIIVKPVLGKDYFGYARVKGLVDGYTYYDASCAAFENDYGNIVCTEVEPLIEEIGQENILLIKVYRQGFTFEGDSRRYVPDGVIDNTIKIFNDGLEEDFYKKVSKHIEAFIYDSPVDD